LGRKKRRLLRSSSSSSPHSYHRVNAPSSRRSVIVLIGNMQCVATSYRFMSLPDTTPAHSAVPVNVRTVSIAQQRSITAAKLSRCVAQPGGISNHRQNVTPVAAYIIRTGCSSTTRFHGHRHCLPPVRHTAQRSYQAYACHNNIAAVQRSRGRAG